MPSPRCPCRTAARSGTWATRRVSWTRSEGRENKDILYKVMDSCVYHVRPSKESGRKETSRVGR